ncbi:MAG: hypothetical protein QM703_27495 [Gemmatales bacterium]
MTVIQGVLDRNGVILSADGVFMAARSSGTEFAITVPGQDVSQAFILATTTFRDNGVPPKPVTIFRPTAPSPRFILMVDPEYGVSFRVEIPNQRNPNLRRTASRTKQKK